MVEALRARASQVTVAHMDAAFWSPSMSGMHDLIEAYRNKDLNALDQRYTDQPVAYLDEMWARERRMRGST